MVTFLRLKKDGISEENAIVFTISKSDAINTPEYDSRLVADVWCSFVDFKKNVIVLRSFFNEISAGTLDRSIFLTFAPMPAETNLKKHGGLCILELFQQGARLFLVRVHLTYVPPGISDPMLFDQCIIHFSTDKESLEKFVFDLETATDDNLEASLYGFETC